MAQALVGVALATFLCGLCLFGRKKSVPVHIWPVLLLARMGRALSFLGSCALIRFQLAQPDWRFLADLLREKIAQKDIFLSRGATSVLMNGIAAGIGLVLFFLSSQPLFFLVGCLLSYALVPWLAQRIQEQRRKQIEKSLPDAYRSLASALGSGKSLPQAMQYVGTHIQGPLGAGFLAASAQFFCGSTLLQGLEQVKRHINSEQSALLISALVVSQQTGAPLATLLEEAAHLLEERMSLRQELQTKTASARLSARVVMLLPVALVLLLALISPDFQKGLTTPIGMLSLFFAACLDGLALILMRSILKGASA